MNTLNGADGPARQGRFLPDRELLGELDHAPRSLDEWIRYYCSSEGARSLSAFIRSLADNGCSEMARMALHEHFAHTEPAISEEQIDTLLYKQRMRGEQRRQIVRYLWELGILSEPAVMQPGQILEDAYAGLLGFHGIPPGSVAELGERLAGRYWAYCASARDPGMYEKGLLTVHGRDTGGRVLAVTEEYRTPGDAQRGESDLHERYEGLVLQKFHRPFMVSNLKLSAHRGNAPAELAAIRFTFITRAEAHADSRIVSMLGLTNVSHRSRDFHASSICFERIPAGFPRPPEEELGSLPAAELPPSVLRRLGSLVVTPGGITRL